MASALQITASYKISTEILTQQAFAGAADALIHFFVVLILSHKNSIRITQNLVERARSDNFQLNHFIGYIVYGLRKLINTSQ